MTVLAIVGIGISVGIFIRQTKASKKLDALRQAPISVSLKKIYKELQYSKMVVLSQIEMTQTSNGSDEDKVSLLKKSLKQYDSSFTNVINKIKEEGEFLRGSIRPELYDSLERVIVQIQGYLSADILEVKFPRSLTVSGQWLGDAPT